MTEWTKCLLRRQACYLTAGHICDDGPMWRWRRLNRSLEGEGGGGGGGKDAKDSARAAWGWGYSRTTKRGARGGSLSNLRPGIWPASPRYTAQHRT